MPHTELGTGTGSFRRVKGGIWPSSRVPLACMSDALNVPAAAEGAYEGYVTFEMYCLRDYAVSNLGTTSNCIGATSESVCTTDELSSL
jgi:hypothetical protein